LTDTAEDSTVTVVVESEGETTLIVANVINPTVNDHGIVMQTATGRNAVSFYTSTGYVYLAVFTATTYTVGVFLQPFEEPEVNLILPWSFASATTTEVYTPTMSVPGSYTFSMSPSMYFELLDTSTGTIGLTVEGAESLFDQSNDELYFGNHTVELYVASSLCAPLR